MAIAKKVLVVGGVAAGTKAAAKIKRENPDWDVSVLTEDTHISYAGCGLPYYMGGIIRNENDLVVRGPAEFRAENDIDVKVGYQVTQIDPSTKTVQVLKMKKEEVKNFAYDKLFIATGASPVLPPIPGINATGVYTVRKVPDALAIRKLVEEKQVQKAVVVGGGFIGLEVAENLCHQGIDTTLVELAPTILPGFDEDIASWVQEQLAITELAIKTNTKVEEILVGDHGQVAGVKTDKGQLPAQLVVWATGVRPNVALAKDAGIELGATGAIKVNEYMETNIPDIYAVGDCAENLHRLTGQPCWFPMGSTANKMGRVAALRAAGESDFKHAGVLGTTIVKLFHINVARTGLTERDCQKLGYNYERVTVPANDFAHYMPGHHMIVTKLIVNKDDRKILGVQIAGRGIVDKPVDVIVAAISFGGTVDQLADLDLAYAPPFSQAMASTIAAANVMINKLTGRLKGVGAIEALELLESPEWQFVDIRPKKDVFETGAIPGSILMPWSELKERSGELDKGKKTVLICKWGKRAYGQVKTMQKLGFPDVLVLEGGIEAWPYELD